MTPRGLAALGLAVKERRAQLGLTQEDVNAQGGPSDTTLTKIENAEGRPPAASTLRKLDTALRWMEGSAKRVLDGEGGPIPLPTEVAVAIQNRAREVGRGLTYPPSQITPVDNDAADSGTDPIDSHLNELASAINTEQRVVLPSGFVAIPFSALVELAILADEAEAATGLTTWVAFEDLDEDQYYNIIGEAEDLERETMSLAEYASNLVREYGFKGDQVALRKLRRQIAATNLRRRSNGQPVWKFRIEAPLLESNTREQ